MTLVLASMTALGPVTMDIYLASMPHIGAALGATTRSVQLTLSSYLIGFAIGQILYGPLSDVYGRRPMLLLGFALYLVATTACAFASSIELLIAARALQGVGSAGPIILARTIVRDLYEGSRAARQLGLMSAIMGITPICAPVLGGFLQLWFGWRASFFGMDFIGLALSLSALLFLPETNQRKSNEPLSLRGILTSFAIVSRHPAYLSYLTLHALSYMAVFAFISSSSHFMQEVYGLSSVQFGFTYAMCSISYIGGTAVGSRLVIKLGLDGMIRLGKNIALAGGLLLIAGYVIFPTQFLGIVVPEMLLFLGIALMVPQMIAGALTPFAERAGAASSLMGFMQMSSASIIGGLLGLSLGNSAWPLVTITCALSVAIFVTFHLTAQARASVVHPD